MKCRSGFEKALGALGGRELNEQAARDLAAIPDGDNVLLAKFIRSQHEWATPQKLQALWTASLLSSPKTMMAKIVGDASMAALDAPVRMVRGFTDAVFSKLSGRPRQYFAGEALPAMAGWFHGLGEGFAKGLQVLQHGISSGQAEDVLARVEAPRYELPGGGANPVNLRARRVPARGGGLKTARAFPHVLRKTVPRGAPCNALPSYALPTTAPSARPAPGKIFNLSLFSHIKVTISTAHHCQ
ncbi:MAG TPA: hypothetical protein VN709_04760 [Terriglobales bacterium]|nr:hypothetical protein [Terriglobales bacterium]